MLTHEEIIILRALAKKYADIAFLPEQQHRRLRWLALNSLQAQRPLVMIDQIPWNEMDVDGFLINHIKDPYWRDVETALRQTIYKWQHMAVDMVVNPYICLPRPFHNTGWGIDVHRDTIASKLGGDIFSQHYTNQILSEADVDRIQMPQITLDSEAEKENTQTASMLFEGIIPFAMTGISMHLGIWDTITMWMGIENCYIELIDRPEMMHRLMEKVTDGLLGMIGQINTYGGFDIHSNLCHCSHTFTHDLPKPGYDPARPTSDNAWAFGLAQLFTSVSPAITDEFEVAYMKRVFPHFGAIYYGCCDRLDDRLTIIEKLPNVRKISCSPWSDRERFAANLDSSRYIMSNKPTPAYLATDLLDEHMIRADLRRTIKAARAHSVKLEFILKDISTVNSKPQQLWRWAEIAMEEATA